MFICCARILGFASALGCSLRNSQNANFLVEHLEIYVILAGLYQLTGMQFKKAISMAKLVEFLDHPTCQEVDGDDVIELIFSEMHPQGGRSKATVQVPASIATQAWVINRSRAAAELACSKLGGGRSMFVSVSLGW